MPKKGDRRKWYSILLVGLVLVLATLSLSCGSRHIDEADDYLKRASRATSDLRRQVELGLPVQNIASELEYIERLIDNARSELQDMRPRY